MAFNLKLVLKALLFSSNQALSIKDIQTVFARFHDQAQSAGRADADGAESVEEGVPAEGKAEDEDAPATEEIAVFAAAQDASAAELYGEVPSLVTAAQIREAMDALAEELKSQGDIYLLIDGAQGYRLATQPRFARWIRVLRDEPPPVKLSQSALETLAIIAYRQPVTRSEIEVIRGVSADAGINRLLERELIYIVGRADLPGRPLQYGTTDQFLEFVGVKSLVELPASDVLSPRQIDEWINQINNTRPPTDAEMGLPLEGFDAETEGAAETDAENGAGAAAADAESGEAAEAAETAGGAEIVETVETNS